ncbi:MAG: DNA replication/repair protein RecF [Clostridiaceae bacterium]|nr:DNA replication/repair protein RecF [Clostridiaceae bacterium]
MIINSLELYSFRNYEKETITFDNSVNLLYGQNAQGKTNVLEALYIAATGKSHRTNTFQDLVQYGKPGFEIHLTAEIDGRTNTILLKYSRDRGRYIEINGIKRDKMSEILGTLNMILFSPETLEVVKGSPSIRRKFLDILLCQTNRQYLYYLQKYNNLIKNKSVALKKWKTDKRYEDVLPVWNEQISVYGGKVAFLRVNCVEKLNEYMKKEIGYIAENKEVSNITYKTYCTFDKNCDEKYFENELKLKLAQGINREFELSQCLIGPHRDDIEILLNGRNSRHYCSQGQQRTLALALIISELLFIEEVKGEKPVLLLDDVMSELDSKRREYLLNSLYDVQTIITATDDLPFDNIKNKKVKKMQVVNGKIVC